MASLPIVRSKSSKVTSTPTLFLPGSLLFPGSMLILGCMNKWIKVLVPMLVCAVAAAGCGRQEMARLDDIESYVQARPDSALAQLRALDPHSLRSRQAFPPPCHGAGQMLHRCHVGLTCKTRSRLF